jgi:predicted nucleic acid-binding protein
MTTRWLLDINVVVHLATQQNCCVAATVRLLLAGCDLILAPQVLFEFWSAATKPLKKNGLGWSSQQTRKIVDALLRTFSLLPEPADLLPCWLDIVTRLDIRGPKSYDARLACWALLHGISNLLTHNKSDFALLPFSAKEPGEI